MPAGGPSASPRTSSRRAGRRSSTRSTTSSTRTGVPAPPPPGGGCGATSGPRGAAAPPSTTRPPPPRVSRAVPATADAERDLGPSEGRRRDRLPPRPRGALPPRGGADLSRGTRAHPLSLCELALAPRGEAAGTAGQLLRPVLDRHR